MEKTINDISLSEIVPGNNDRRTFDPVKLRELADSIARNGLAQPITVRRLDDCDMYQIVAGERRFRAAQLLGWDSIPVIVADLDDEQAAAVMLAENTSRSDLDPIDEAQAYQTRITVYGWSSQKVAEVAGVSANRVTLRVKLLRLRTDIQQLVRNGDMSLGYAQILADAGLDVNFQLLAMSKLRDMPNPTPGWFRGIISELLEKQAQATMFGDSLWAVQETTTTPTRVVDPPHPATHKPPRNGKTAREVLEGQATFWKDAASDWAKLGRLHKKQECEAAAAALQAAIAALPVPPPQPVTYTRQRKAPRFAFA